MTPGIYLHVPFCTTTCDFCAFYQKKPDSASIEQYLNGIDAELAALQAPIRSAFENAPSITVFWGGGTPGLLPRKAIERLGQSLHARFGAPVEEWSVEMAPATVNPGKLKALREIGVTRISLGIQSFSSEWLEKLGRDHTPEQGYRAYDMIRSAGFDSVNLDLMFALPGQDKATWFADLDEALRLQPDHLSTYCLTFEEDTALWVKLAKGQVKLDPEHEADLYLATWEKLADAGLQQYEVSNFARDGHRCEHNLNTWRMGQWLGLGPAAASQLNNRRWTNVDDLQQWARGQANGSPQYMDEMLLSEATLAGDAILFGLRMNDGVNLTALATRFPQWGGLDDARQKMQHFAEEGLVVMENDSCRLTEKGRLVADSVGAEFIV